MNIIEDIRDALLHAVEKRSPPPRTPMYLLTAVQDSCCKFPPGYLQTPVESMPRRFASLLRAGGDPTRYQEGVPVFLALPQIALEILFINPLTPSGPQNLTTFVYGGFVDIWIREMDSSAFSLFLLTVGGRKRTGA
ncbi:hypothetical protein AVEN_240326-1 [Araneus ventricosus]|uniref:Uncharacterized protein n=1 Tax=Araneus ventricosus TaxID=182803 RepID=A0A4Y2F099_ARAVE|nr:hypothetical protein AVEN_240326-1 [Araneus ventricosus]